MRSIAPKLTLQESAAQFNLGQEYQDELGRIWKYVKANGAITQYQHVVISADGNYEIVPLDTDTAGHGAGKVNWVGCAQIAFTDNYFGWIFVGCGIYTGKVAASCAQNVPLHATSAAGVIDDASTTTLLPGVFLITTATGAADASLVATGRMCIAGI